MAVGWSWWIRETALVHRISTRPFLLRLHSPEHPIAALTSSLSRSFHFPFHVSRGSLRVATLKIPQKKKKKKRNHVRAPDQRTMNTPCSIPRPALLLSSRRRRRTVRVEGHAWACTRSAWVRGVYTRLGLSTCKCQWRLKIGRRESVRVSFLTPDIPKR